MPSLPSRCPNVEDEYLARVSGCDPEYSDEQPWSEPWCQCGASSECMDCLACYECCGCEVAA